MRRVLFSLTLAAILGTGVTLSSHRSCPVGSTEISSAFSGGVASTTYCVSADFDAGNADGILFTGSNLTAITVHGLGHTITNNSTGDHRCLDTGITGDVDNLLVRDLSCTGTDDVIRLNTADSSTLLNVTTTSTILINGGDNNRVSNFSAKQFSMLNTLSHGTLDGTIIEWGTLTADSETSLNIVRCTDDGSGVTFQHNTFAITNDTSSQAIQWECDDSSVIHNTINYSGLVDGFPISIRSGADRTLFGWNYLNSNQDCINLGTGSGDPSTATKLLNNVVICAGHGVRILEGSYGNFIWGNLITAGTNAALWISDDATPAASILRNTLYCSGTCPAIQFQDATTTGYDMRDNIFWSDGDYAREDTVNPSPARFDGGAADYNLYFRSGGGNVIGEDAGTTTHATLAAYQSANATLEINSVEGDPTFNDAANGDYLPTANAAGASSDGKYIGAIQPSSLGTRLR